MGAVAANSQIEWNRVTLMQQNRTAQSGASGSDILQRRLDQLITQLMLVKSSTGRLVVLGDISKTTIQTLLSIPNVDRAIDAIFRREHPTFPLVHRPTFNAHACSLSLLLTVFLAGHMHTCPSDLDPEVTGIYWLDLFEEYVFDHQCFSPPAHQQPSNTDPRQASLEPIIAAIVVTWQQLGSTNVRTRTRMHRQRLPAIMDAAKAINLFHSSHRTAVVEKIEASWRSWIEDEMAIRTSAYLFFLDCELATFYRVLPHLAIADLHSGLPSAEAAFAATNIDAWYLEVSRTNGKESPPLRAATSMLTSCDATTNREAWGDSASIHGLLLVLCAVHHIIFTSQANYILEHMRLPLQNALSNWKLIWDDAIVKVATSDVFNISETQYCKFGTDFYWLAHALLHPGNTDPENTTADIMADIHDLLRM
jgi:hypothetical protein